MSFWSGRRVYVVGGSKGIGRQAAIEMARQGASVAIGARGRPALDESLEAIRAAGPGPHAAVEVDVSDTASVTAAAERVLAELGGLETLVCCTGHAETGPALDVPEEQFQRMMNTNYMGHVRNVRALGPRLRDQGRGDICLVTSMVAVTGFYGYGAYGASKAAIVQMAEALRMEMKLHGVRVSVFYPPTTDTPGLATENQTKDPVLHVAEAESMFNATHPPERVAVQLLRAIERGRFHNYATMDSWVMWQATRHVPRIAHYLADDELRKAAKKVEERRAKGLDPKTGEPAAG